MQRIVLIEGSSFGKKIPMLAGELGLHQHELIECLYETDSYICKRLSINHSLSIDRERFSFSRVAGIIKASDQLEIEIVPKFMSGDEHWRTDLLLLLSRMRWGSMFENQTIHATKTKDRSIDESLAIVFLSQFEKASRLPIRTYKRSVLRQFEIDGDLDEETILNPERDGFRQEVTKLTKRNEYNAVISSASKVLASSIVDFDLIERLRRIDVQLGAQDSLPKAFKRTVPNRYRAWRALYELSIDILGGYGIDYSNQGVLESPGFIVRTSDAWEELLRQALVLGMEGFSVSYQEKHAFAKRDNSTVKVRPDYTVRGEDGSSLLVDAKYKYRDAKNRTISNADIYEGWAFMEATGIPRLVLIYPYSNNDGVQFSAFQHVADENREIIGVRCNPQLIGTQGLRLFGDELGSYLKDYLVNQSHYNDPISS